MSRSELDHTHESGFGRFFFPGPTEVHPAVLAAMIQPMTPHRGRAIVDLLERADRALRAVFQTKRAILIGSCSATGFMEMAVRSGVRRRALCLVSGAYGERFAGVVSATGRQAIRLNVPLGATVEPDMLADALRRSNVDAVTVVHSETSTGALAPLGELAEVVREREDVVLLVDCVSSIGGSPVETDSWGLDFVFTGSQHALALPPGLAFGAASERMVDRARKMPERGAYLDLLAHVEAAARHQPTHTPSIPLLRALSHRLGRIEGAGGIRACWTLHDAMRSRVERWIEGAGGQVGFSYLPPEGRRSWTTSCLRVPVGVAARELVKRLGRLGWIVGSGYGALKNETLRIGHMGEHSVDMVDALLDTIVMALP